MTDHIMNETTQVKTEKWDDSMKIIELETVSKPNKDSIQMIEPEMLAQSVKGTQGIPQERRRSLRREATRANLTKTPEPKQEARKHKRKPASKRKALETKQRKHKLQRNQQDMHNLFKGRLLWHQQDTHNLLKSQLL